MYFKIKAFLSSGARAQACRKEEGTLIFTTFY